MPDLAAQFRSRLRPLQALVHDAVDAVTYLVDEGHESTARAVVRGVAAVAPGLERPTRLVDGVRRGSTRGVLGAVRLVNRSVQAVVDGTADLADVGRGEAPPVDMRSDSFVSLDGAADQLVGVLNGFIGDHLAHSGNGLDLGLRVRYGDAWLDLDPESVARGVDGAGTRLLVLVHGLATTELSWSLDAERGLGDASAHFGRLLRDELGFTPLYVRYNSGLPVLDNGRRLSDALQALLDGWPRPVDEIVLLGHSMGGLVSRAATREAGRSSHLWVDRLSHVVCLGSPHHGAPLARLGESATRIFERMDLPASRILGKVLDRRSAGVKDLRHAGLDATGPLLDGVTYLFVAGSLASRSEHAVAQWLGDALVPVHSASGPSGPRVVVRRFGGVSHPQLQTHRGVYEAVRDVLSGAPQASAPDP